MGSSKVKPKPRRRQAAPPLPANCEALMSPATIQAAIQVSERQLRKMIAAGEYPRPDTHLGPLMPRWLRSTHDEWVRSKRRQGVETTED